MELAEGSQESTAAATSATQAYLHRSRHGQIAATDALQNKSRVTKWRTSRRVEKIWKNLSIVMDGGNIGKVGKSENFKTDEERKDRDEEKLCKSIIRGVGKKNRERHAILAGC